MSAGVIYRQAMDRPVTGLAEDFIDAGRRAVREWRLGDADRFLIAALQADPESAEAHYLRGEALFLQRRLNEALRYRSEARRLGADRDDYVRGRCMSGVVPGDFAWMTHMLRGDFPEAWQLSDAILREKQTAPESHDIPRHVRSVWRGQPLTGRILIRCHQGLGDTIQFIRYVSRLQRDGTSVAVAAPPALAVLLSSMTGIDRIVPNNTPSGDEFDVEIEVAELPYALRSTLADISCHTPYLTIDSVHIAAAAQRLGAPDGRRRIGLCWSSGAWKAERSLSLAALAGLGSLPGVALFSLQRGPAAAEWRQFSAHFPNALGELTSDNVVDTAATILNLDLVISVDTMVAHLAGALNAPTWTLLHFAADWRWLLERSDTPWYPRMRLWRQPAIGDWSSLVDDTLRSLAC